MPVRTSVLSLALSLLKLVFRLFFDRRVPVYTKVIPVLAIAYLVFPTDIVADRIPLLGQIDDLVVVVILFLLFVAAVPKDILADQTIGRHMRNMPGFGSPFEPSLNRESDDDSIETTMRYVEDEEDQTKK